MSLTPFSAFLRNDSDSRDMNVDGSGSDKDFYYQAPAGKIAYIQRVVFTLRGANIRPNRFGPLDTLSSGLLVRVMAAGGGVELDFLDGEAIKDADHFSYLGGQHDFYLPGNGDDTFVFDWRIDRLGSDGNGYQIGGGEQIRVTVRDDLSGIKEFRSIVQGMVER